MKKVMWIISFVSLIVTAVVLQFLPESIPMHQDLSGNIDRWGSRNESLIFPVIILALSLFWTLFMMYYEKKAKNAPDEKEAAGAKANAKVLGIVGALMAGMFTVMQFFMLYNSYKAVPGAQKETMDIGKVSVILMGIVFIIAGNFMTKTRINGSVGVRISWSMYNDNTWRKTNRFGAVVLMIIGALTVIAAVFMKSSLAATFVGLGLIIAAAVVILIYAHKVYKDEIRTEKEDTKNE